MVRRPTSCCSSSSFPLARTARIRSEGYMKTLKLLLVFLLALPALASAQGKLNVVATTEDLGALAREVGGDKVSVTALAKGYQDPHFVDPKPSFILAVSKADL